MKKSEIRNQVAIVIDACESKKAENVSILEMQGSSSSFTDYFVISSGSNPRQVQSIAEEIELRLKREGLLPNSVEGYQRAEWILIDYVDFVVHVFHEPTRKFYDLERLWKSAKRLTAADLKTAPRKKRESTAAVATKRSKTARSKTTVAIGEAVRSATTRSKPTARKNPDKTKANARERARKKK